jgi:hypothetical protein
MKRFVLAIALACALSGSTLAGEMHTTGAPAPGDTPIGGAPAPGDMGGGGRTDGEMGNGGAAALLLILDLLF